MIRNILKMIQDEIEESLWTKNIDASKVLLNFRSENGETENEVCSQIFKIGRTVLVEIKRNSKILKASVKKKEEPEINVEQRKITLYGGHGRERSRSDCRC